MKLYRGQLINVNEIGKKPVSQIDPATIAGASMTDIDYKYMGQLLLCSNSREFASRVVILRFLLAFSDDQIREKLISGEVIPAVIEMEVNDEEIYEIAEDRTGKKKGDILQKYVSGETLSRECVIHEPTEFKIKLFSMRNIARIMAMIFEPAAEMAYPFTYFYTDLVKFVDEVPAEYLPEKEEVLSKCGRFQEDSAIRKAYLDAGKLAASGFTFPDFLRDISKVDGRMLPPLINFLSRYLFSHTGIGSDASISEMTDESLFIATHFPGRYYQAVEDLAAKGLDESDLFARQNEAFAGIRDELREEFERINRESATMR